MATWTIQTGEANPEGTTVAFRIRVTADDAQEIGLDDLALPDDTNDTLDLPKMGSLWCWRVQSAGGVPALVEIEPSFQGANNNSPLVYSMTAPATDGQGKVFVEFTLGLKPNSTRRIAMNNDARSGEHYLGAFAAGWVTLKLKRDDAIVDIASQAFGSSTVFGGTRVGTLPSTGSHPLKLRVSTEAQWVKEGGAVTNLGVWNDLTGEDDLTAGGTDKPDLDAVDSQPTLTFNGASAPGRYISDTSPPLIRDTATIAVTFLPGTPSTTATVVGRYNATPSWRLYYNDGAAKAVYQASGGSVVSNDLQLEPEDNKVFAVVRRNGATGVTNLTGWINGRLVTTATAATGVVQGSHRLSVAARADSNNDWIEPLAGQVNEVSLYDTELTDLELSLVMHEMAARAKVELGMPIPSAYQTQPYNTGDPRPLQRRPIAVISLYSGRYNDNIFGQSTTNWYGKARNEIAESLRDTIRLAMTGCDHFEIMFNRPGGKFSEDIVASYVFNTTIVTTTQWEGMKDVWDDTGWNGMQLSDHNDGAAGLRRGWFYTGGGLPLNDDGTLDDSGHMGDRVVAPVLAGTYRAALLERWTDTGLNTNADTRFRCFFLDAAVNFSGKMCELAHEGGGNGIRANYTLVGEAIPQSGFGADGLPTRPLEYAARKGAPWFGLASLQSGPWWNLGTNDTTRTSIDAGYNAAWSAGDWSTTPLYFGVQTGSYLDLSVGPGEQPPGFGANMYLGDIYRWVVKGGTPVAWQGGYAKVGAAWDYGTNRIQVSRVGDTTRIFGVTRV